MFHTLRCLSEKEHDIYICGYESELHSQDPTKISKFGTLLARPGGFRDYSIYDAIKFSLLRKPITVFQKYDPEILKYQLEKIDEKVDLIFFEGIQVARHLDIAKKYFPDAKIIIREHNVEFELLQSISRTSNNIFKKALYGDQSRLLKKFELDVLRKADLVLSITEDDRQKLFLCNEKLEIKTIPAGTLLPEQIGLSRSENKLLAISSWKWEPNLFGITWFLEEVWDDLLKIAPDLELHIAGNGLPEKLYANRPNIIYHGFVEDLEPLKQSCTAFIAPLFSGSGMKIKILDALSSQIPVVTTKTGAAGIGLTDDKNVVLFDDRETLISKLDQLLKDPMKRTQIGVNGYSHIADHYSWTSIGEELNETVNNLVNN